MLSWIDQHSAAITAVTSVGTFVIWLVYAQLLYSEFRRQRHPKLIINRGSSRNLESVCIIGNMSKEPVFVQMLYAVLETAQGHIVMDITDCENRPSLQDSTPEDTARSSDASIPLRELTIQGPLDSGAYLKVGTFRGVIERMATPTGASGNVYEIHDRWTLQRLSIQIIATYGPEDYPIGAERTFSIEADKATLTLRPESWNTRRKTSWRARNKLKKFLMDFDRQTDGRISTIEADVN